MNGYKILNSDYTYKGYNYTPVAECLESNLLEYHGFYFFTSLEQLVQEYKFNNNYLLVIVNAEDEYSFSSNKVFCKKNTCC